MIRAPGSAASIAATISSTDATGPSRLCTDAPSARTSLARTNASPASATYWSCSEPPNGISYASPRAAATIAAVGAEVSPWSRPGP